jgi:xanthine dehydrogenase accessory factor
MSAPRPVGAVRRLRERRDLQLGVGRLVESDVVEQAKDVLDNGEPKLLTYGISDDEAFRSGCRAAARSTSSSSASVTVADRLIELAHSDERAVLFTVVEGSQPGAKLLVLLDRDGETVRDASASLAALAPEIGAAACRSTRARRCSPRSTGRRRDSSSSAPSAAEALCGAAKLLGWHVCVDAEQSSRRLSGSRAPTS